MHDEGEHNVLRSTFYKVIFAVLKIWLYRPYNEFETSQSVFFVTSYMTSTLTATVTE